MIALNVELLKLCHFLQHMDLLQLYLVLGYGYISLLSCSTLSLFGPTLQIFMQAPWSGIKRVGFTGWMI